MASTLTFASKKVRILEATTYCLLFRVNPNPIFVVLDVVDPYGRRRSSAPRKKIQNPLTGLVLRWSWWILKKETTHPLFDGV